ncbi:tRNA (adenosine(37)-N6)-threonylcarbamoyltransferase complex ATPase subunit type 1 TsaE [Algoriphagus persicinus]|uniref:tRNA (adenosine(37)-N6)-threonylcarbamoyltransferase complex ATPase subunit type 1 TsaE n=1 Tax=Algoriphagus persicinus TaxID=3108754 RepID=UPI002B37282C|nr:MULTISPECIES: tRNA (adenosine(37)-N6)-threonylcarbamoyltransferase complex ATPase subunit type 1 TsaE [unclassified Algoriphagus]MEB2781948.1 tRNA (adenosine(37)-N6)-threonylcarbamoyltransferase complex ATPase subunit type 1 TsaE [Algoriphagus sp. C2-6-M1]MEB2785702.1 tRNA (adenosine(37)-N6)-threonylcarbamoyltransferase complex ATPase subunit type 1 TsaE [Algoriphagus sp. E1-3-M2]
MSQFTYELTDIEKAAQVVIKVAADKKVWVFQGDMGAGKTTLIKALAKAFSVTDQVSSPTFGIVNHYENHGGELFYHFDFYRIDDPTEALDIGIEEYFYSGNYCWLEWAEKIAAFLPENFLLVRIHNDSETQRTLTLQHVENAS